MIVFDLRCANDHVFEAWFGSSADYESQQQRSLVACPICDSTDIAKAVMAPAIGAKSNQRPSDKPASTDAQRKQALQQLAAFQAKIEENSDYVGRDFAREARARHERGELQKGKRGLIGEASIADAAELIDDGIPVQPLPFRLRRTADA